MTKRKQRGDPELTSDAYMCSPSSKSSKIHPIIDLFDDGFTVHTENMTPFEMYGFVLDDVQMYVKKTENGDLELFSE